MDLRIAIQRDGHQIKLFARGLIGSIVCFNAGFRLDVHPLSGAALMPVYSRSTWEIAEIFCAIAGTSRDNHIEVYRIESQLRGLADDEPR